MGDRGWGLGVGTGQPLTPSPQPLWIENILMGLNAATSDIPVLSYGSKESVLLWFQFEILIFRNDKYFSQSGSYALPYMKKIGNVTR